MIAFDFNCLLIYLTPNGHRKQASFKTTAIAADVALEVAERLLRNDARRKVASVIYGKAIQA